MANEQKFDWPSWEAQAREKYGVKDPWKITEERFWEMLNVLPPCRWIRGANTEFFHVSERLSGNIVTWIARLGTESEGDMPLYLEFQNDAALHTSMLYEIIDKAGRDYREGKLPTTPPPSKAVAE